MVSMETAMETASNMHIDNGPVNRNGSHRRKTMNVDDMDDDPLFQQFINETSGDVP